MILNIQTLKCLSRHSDSLMSFKNQISHKDSSASFHTLYVGKIKNKMLPHFYSRPVSFIFERVRAPRHFVSSLARAPYKETSSFYWSISRASRQWLGGMEAIVAFVKYQASYRTACTLFCYILSWCEIHFQLVFQMSNFLLYKILLMCNLFHETNTISRDNTIS